MDIPLPQPLQLQDIPSLTADVLREGCILVVDKPLGWSSFDVVNRFRNACRRKFKLRKLKVGHAGTLDPLATGVLMLCTGKLTRQIDRLQAQAKIYTGTLLLGATTPSFDLETEIDATFPTNHLTSAQVAAAAKKLSGEQLQYPPVFSARHVDGKRAYLSARAGKQPYLKPRRVWVHRFEVNTTELPQVSFTIHCSKGTYIRSLASDLGRLLNNGAHLTSLCRTHSGAYHLAQALNLDDLLRSVDALPQLTDFA